MKVKAEILKNEKSCSTILEETGHIAILDLLPGKSKEQESEQNDDLEKSGFED